jgi:hypothetical protein
MNRNPSLHTFLQQYISYISSMYPYSRVMVLGLAAIEERSQLGVAVVAKVNGFVVVTRDADVIVDSHDV